MRARETGGLIAATARNQRAPSHDFVAAPAVSFLPFQERMSLHVTRTLRRSVIYCVACYLSSYLLASEQMQRAVRLLVYETAHTQLAVGS